MLHIHAAVAERRLISQRTKDALAAKKAAGFKLGGLNARGIEALARAEQLRPVLAELAGLSQGKMAAGVERPRHSRTSRRPVARRRGQAGALAPCHKPL